MPQRPLLQRRENGVGVRSVGMVVRVPPPVDPPGIQNKTRRCHHAVFECILTSGSRPPAFLAAFRSVMKKCISEADVVAVAQLGCKLVIPNATVEGWFECVEEVALVRKPLAKKTPSLTKASRSTIARSFTAFLQCNCNSRPRVLALAISEPGYVSLMRTRVYARASFRSHACQRSVSDRSSLILLSINTLISSMQNLGVCVTA